jgi:hypothetical protein
LQISLLLGFEHTGWSGCPDDDLVPKRFDELDRSRTDSASVVDDESRGVQFHTLENLPNRDEGMWQMVSGLHSLQNEESLAKRESLREFDYFHLAVIGMAAWSDVTTMEVLRVADHGDRTE